MNSSNNLNVIYSLSTAPFFAKKMNTQFEVDKFELYTAALSSLTRQKEGNITIMHCDKHAYDYIKQKGLLNLWSEVRITLPDNFYDEKSQTKIDARMFWAAGKLFALRATQSPVLMLDTDFIAWKLPKLSNKIIAAHHEDLSPNVYPPISHFEMNEEYTFAEELDYEIKPLNTAFLYLPCEEFKQFYIEHSLEFMRNSKSCDDYLTYMVYAEQRLLPMLAKLKGAETETLLNFPNLNENNEHYTHIWGAKQVMRDNPKELERFLAKCRKRIRHDFPECEWIISKIES
ncbi:MAG: hypothetical protein FWF76_03115 [Oscillospiraceae bacterium]|nr:hypothetical protein [Oscillospiraceae bacterium]